MIISARNQFAGKVVKVQEGAVNGIVTIDAKGVLISGTISMAAIKELGLKEGENAVAIIKATEVLVGLGELNLSARNKFRGVVTDINEGAVNDIVKIQVTEDMTVSATISNAAVKELELKKGCEAVAVVKATSVMFGK